MRAFGRNFSLRVASVPEQVNIPIQICKEKHHFEAYLESLRSNSSFNQDNSIGIEYVSVPEGTGRMMELLEKGEIDLALAVTDAFISNRAKGIYKNSVLCGTYVRSPLIWALCGRGSSIDEGNPKISFAQKVNANTAIKYGISRIGSGSHTMAFYYDFERNDNSAASLLKTTSKSDFVIANNFQQLREGVNRGDFDAFLWETFTTKPWFDNGELTKLGEVSAPWPAFSFITIIYSNKGDTSSSNSSDDLPTWKLKELLIKDCFFPAVRDGIQEFVDIANREASVARIVKDFKHTEEDAVQWLNSCKYAESVDMRVDEASLEHSIKVLKEIGLVPPSFLTSDLWTEENKIIFLG